MFRHASTPLLRRSSILATSTTTTTARFGVRPSIIRPRQPYRCFAQGRALSDASSQRDSVDQKNTAAERRTAASEEGSGEERGGRENAQQQQQQEATSRKTSEAEPETTEEAATSTSSSTTPQGVKLQDLPDLTKGIPSTILQELDSRAQGSRHSLPNITEDPDAGASPAGGGGGARRRGGGGGGGAGDEEFDDMPEHAYVSSTDRRREKTAKFAYGLFFTTAAAFMAYLGRDWETREEEEAHAAQAPSGWGVTHWWNRVRARAHDITSYYKDPPFAKLLPDDDPMMRPPYTLVLSLEDLLVHSSWDREHGWRTAKRPGVDVFLRYLSQYYELVLFTSVPAMSADPVLRSLDPFRIIRWPLFREATLYEDGEYVKDLSYLNRDLSKVIVLDSHAPHLKKNPENAIILPKWQGNPKDRTLLQLIPFLEFVSGLGINDVRSVLKSYEGSFIPAEFARREQRMRERHAQALVEEKNKKPKYSISGLAKLLGLKPQPTFEGLESGPYDSDKMILDQLRERGRRQFEFLENEIRVNGEKFLAEMAEEEEKFRQEQTKGMQNSFFSFLGVQNDKQ